jgi:3-isopropylmalate dehydrogenase
MGPGVVAEARAVLEEAGARFGRALSFETHPVGGAAIDECGDPLPPATLEACRRAGAILLGAVGGPRWDDPEAPVRPEQGLLRLRKELALYANLRPVAAHPALAAASPIREERLAGTDLLVVRELTGGLYYGEPRFVEETAEGARAVDTLVYTEAEIRRVLRLAFRLAASRRGKLTSVDKANVLFSSRLWRRVAGEVAKEFPEVALEHLLVDAAAMRLVSAPASFDVLCTENLFGDILSDEASVLAGSLGMLPSASVGDGGPGLFEPVHGSAPDIAGAGTANPVGAVLSAAMLLRHGLGMEDAADAVERAVAAALDAGPRTPDLGGDAGTRDVGAAIRSRLALLPAGP